MKISNMKDIIEFAANEYGDSTAFKYKVKKDVVASKSYKELKQDIDAVSNSLKNIDMLGKHVAIIGPTTYEWIISYFGVVNSGGVIVPIDVQLSAKDICELIERADVELLIYDEVRADVANAVRMSCEKVKCFISMQQKEDTPYTLSLSKLIEENRGEFSFKIDNEKLCAILFTSGTTGKSKGVMLNHRNLAENATCVDMHIKPGTVSLTVLPIHHAYCFSMDILKGISLGLCICINDSIMRVQKNMKLFKPEVLCLVPMVIESMYNKLQDATGVLPKKLIAKAAFGGNLRTIYSGGAYLNPDLIEGFAKYGISIYQGYGMTESSPLVSTNNEVDNKEGSVGKLVSNCIAKVVDEEIWIKGSSVMMGYYKMPKETSETLVDGWLKTGDLGYVDEDNYIFITGRKKNLIILSNGENISPEELENALGSHRIVKEILVSGEGDFIKAEIFPDYEYAKKKKVKDVKLEIEVLVAVFNDTLPSY